MNGNPFSGLNTYERRHVPAHLAEVHRFEDLHALFEIESEGGGNGWYEIKQERNEAADYLSDVAVAWTAAEQQQEYGLECRYALTSATWNTLASSAHPLMYPALVERGIWTAERAFAAALRTSLFRPETLGLLTPYLEPTDRNRAFTEIAADLQKAGSSLGMRLEKIGHLLPEPLVREILSLPSTWSGNGQPVRESEALLLPRLAELGYADEARAWAEALPESPERFRALCGIAPFLAPEQGAQLLEALAVQFRPSESISPDDACLRALAQGFAALGHADRAIESARRDNWPGTRDGTLEIVATALARAGRPSEALQCAGRVEHSHRAAVILARVSDQLSGAERLEQLDAALKLAREQWRGQVDALRIKALAEVGSRLPDPDPVLTEALDAALARDRFGQGSSIAEIARLLTPRLLRKALSQLQTIQDRVESCRVLAEAAVACRGEAGTRIGHTACGSIAKIDEVHKRWAALLRLLRVREIRSELIVLLARTADEMTGEQWASEEALALPDPLDDEIAEIALRAAQKNPDARAAFVTALAPCISDRLFASVTELAAKIEDAERRDSAFAAIAPRAPKERIAVLVEVCANPEHDGSDRLRAAVAKRLAELGQHEGAMSLARRIKDREQRLPVFASIANAAPDPQPAIAEIIEHLNALTWRPPLLYVSRIAGMLPQELAAPVLLAAREWAVRVQNDRDTILEDIAGPLAETGLVAEARSAAEDIADAAKKVRALTAVSNAAPEPARSDALKRALDLANEMPEELRKSLALAELLPHLAESDCERVSSRIDIQALAAEQPTWVADIVPQLLPTRAHELLRLDRDEINAAVVEHTRDLPADEVRILWESANHRAGARTRPGALVSLRLTLPWIHHLGGHTALERICQAITDVTRWWP